MSAFQLNTEVQYLTHIHNIIIIIFNTIHLSCNVI